MGWVPVQQRSAQNALGRAATGPGGARVIKIQGLSQELLLPPHPPCPPHCSSRGSHPLWSHRPDPSSLLISLAQGPQARGPQMPLP